MDFELNEDQRAFADTAQQFADERLAVWMRQLSLNNSQWAVRRRPLS